MHFGLKLTLSFIALLSLFACGNPAADKKAATNQSNEASYCTPKSAGSSPMTISGKAYYQAREVTATGLGAPMANKPIRGAEIEIYKKSAVAHKGAQNVLVQCGQTDDTGAFSLNVPRDSGVYVIQVNSRGNNSLVKASILNNPTDNDYYSIKAEVTISSANYSLSDNALVASYQGSLEGGAFNILDQIYAANAFLRTALNSSNHSCSGCTASFSVAPKVSVYWTPGFNPGSYFGAGPLSFYIPEDDTLYILGGSDGNTDDVDTDHFDNSIILHEYGHFIEDQYSRTDSPGGSHNGNSVIDPRLAWGEGWADFFQAAVTGNPIYRDTTGNISGTTSLLFNENLETRLAGHDVATTLGEGNFREFAITRALWDFIDTNAESTDAETAELDFAYLWEIFTDSTDGFDSSNIYFRNIGHFYELLVGFLTNESFAGLADVQAVIADELQREDRTDYAARLVSGSCTQTNSAPLSAKFSENGSYAQSDQFHSNDFYLYYHPGGAMNITLTYSQVGVGNPADLDLHIYQQKYVFDSDYSDMVGFSDDLYGTEENGTESVSVASVAKGYYLINVKVYTANQTSGNDANYLLSASGSALCLN